MLMNADENSVIDSEKQEFELPEMQTYWIHYLITIGFNLLLKKFIVSIVILFRTRNRF